MVLAATFGPLALRERGRIEDGCGADRSCTSGQVQRMDGFALGADIGLGVAVVGATAAPSSPSRTVCSPTVVSPSVIFTVRPAPAEAAGSPGTGTPPDT